MLWLPLWGRGPGVTFCLKLLLAADLTQSLTSLTLSCPTYKMGLADHGLGVGMFCLFCAAFHDCCYNVLCQARFKKWMEESGTN